MWTSKLDPTFFQNISLREHLEKFVQLLSENSAEPFVDFFEQFCSGIQFGTSTPLLYIEGNIGAGKSTFLNYFTNLGDNIAVIDEPLFIWQNIVDGATNTDSLAHFYKALAEKYALFVLKFELLALFTRVCILVEKINNNPDAKLFVSERSIFTDR